MEVDNPLEEKFGKLNEVKPGQIQNEGPGNTVGGDPDEGLNTLPRRSFFHNILDNLMKLYPEVADYLIEAREKDRVEEIKTSASEGLLPEYSKPLKVRNKDIAEN